MNILFIYSLQEIESINRPLRSPEDIQLGISYISSLLKKSGHETKLVVLSRVSGSKNNKEILDKQINNFRPGLICFTAVFSEYGFIADIAKYLKSRYKNIFLLIGGVHASLNPEQVLKDDFDALCIGEGEHPTLELANHLESKIPPINILNLWIKHGQTVNKNPTRPFLEDLDSLPFPDREMWKDWIDEQPDARHTVLLGRGCPYECTYCCNHALKKIASGQYVRLRSPDKIINELRENISRYPEQKKFYFEIETFYTNKAWAFDLCSKLEELNKTLSCPLSFGVNLRIMPNVDYENLFIAFKKSNFEFVNIGLESGSEKIRRDILKRYYSNSDIINAVKLARQHGLKVAFFNLIGVPGETIADFQETLKLNRICQPDWNMTSIFFPYPGTDLYSFCKDNFLLDGFLDTASERNKAVLNLPGFPKKKVQKSYEWFYYDIYKSYKPSYNRFFNMLVMKLRPHPKLFYLYKTIRRSLIYNKIKSSLNRYSYES